MTAPPPCWVALDCLASSGICGTPLPLPLLLAFAVVVDDDPNVKLGFTSADTFWTQAELSSLTTLSNAAWRAARALLAGLAELAGVLSANPTASVTWYCNICERERE